MHSRSTQVLQVSGRQLILSYFFRFTLFAGSGGWAIAVTEPNAATRIRCVQRMDAARMNTVRTITTTALAIAAFAGVAMAAKAGLTHRFDGVVGCGNVSNYQERYDYLLIIAYSAPHQTRVYTKHESRVALLCMRSMLESFRCFSRMICVDLVDLVAPLFPLIR